MSDDSSQPYRSLLLLLLTLAIGAVGGAVFAWIGTPLPWMLGALVFTMTAAIAGVRLHMRQMFRRIWMVVLGVMLGSSFGPDVVDHLAAWMVSVVGMLLFVTASGAFAYWYFRRFGGLDSRTALFCSAPGGLGEMMLLGPAMGADERSIALIHAVRIVLVVLLIPPAYALVAGYVPPPTPGGSVGILDIALDDLGILALTGLVGAVVAKLIRLPAWQMSGPMLASAVVHAGGITGAAPPAELVAAAQVVIGAGAGSRFDGVRPRELLRPILLSAGSTVTILIFAAIAAAGVAALTGFDFKAVHLAYSPGGFAEMSLIALSLGIEVPFVSLHHMGRIFFVVIVAILISKLIWRGQPPGVATRPDQT